MERPTYFRKSPLRRRTVATKYSRRRTAGTESLLDVIVSQDKWLEVADALEALPDKSLVQFFNDVGAELWDRLKLDRSTMDALTRFVDLTESYKQFQPDLIRNILGKALNDLGLKTPLSF